MLPFRCHGGLQSLTNPVILGFFGPLKLFPLNRCTWLRRQIIANTIYIGHFCQNPVCNLQKDIPRNLLDLCCHSINGIYCTKDNRILEAAGIVLHTHRLEVRNNSKILPYSLIQSSLCKLFTKNRIRFSYCFQAVSGNCAKTSYTKVLGMADGKPYREEVPILHHMREPHP